MSATDKEFLLSTKSLPNDLNFMPTVGNGHLGYTIFGNAIYMNGVYNGIGGNSRRGRIPNWLNLSVSIVHNNDDDDNDDDVNVDVTEKSSLYEMNLYDGYFRWWESIPTLGLTLEQRTYPHRFYNRALIYELLVQRTETKAPLKLKLTQSSGNASEAFNFFPLSVGGDDANAKTNKLNEKKTKWKLLKGVTKSVENEIFQKETKTIFIILSEDLEHGKLLEMTAGQSELYYRYILTADEDVNVASREMETVMNLEPSVMLSTHTIEWNKFWNTFNIQINNNIALSQVINAGIFYLASSLPSLNSSQPNKEFYGLSPTGLGRGHLEADYEGHNFWDTEIWMFPVVTQLSKQWARELLEYRLRCLPGAQYNARTTGYKGARYPWESAYTGTEVTQPDYPEVAANEVHITADIAIAFRHFFATTNDGDFLCEKSWPVLKEISEFLVDRTEWNSSTEKYHIKNVMGPDEDHEDVNDSVYTNFSFKIALQFASYVQKTCAPTDDESAAWSNVADKLFIPYDSVLNYHPQFSGYRIGEKIKQADAILLGYPLQFEMNDTTRLNDLRRYESVTRESGPAMTWSMFAINFLDTNETDKANHYFLKSFNGYVRQEFKVWSEVKKGYEGAANFLTGIGGFLQAIINGYAGLRFHHEKGISILEIKRRHMLPKTTGFKIHGLFFAGARFDLTVESNEHSEITFTSVANKKMKLSKGQEIYEIRKGFSIHLGTQPVFIRTVS